MAAYFNLNNNEITKELLGNKLNMILDNQFNTFIKFLIIRAFKSVQFYFTPGELGRYDIDKKSSSVERKFRLV